MRYDRSMDINEPTEQPTQIDKADEWLSDPEQSTDNEMTDNKPAEKRGMGMAYKPERSSETKHAFETLEKILLEDDADPHHRIMAARVILDFAHL